MELLKKGASIQLIGVYDIRHTKKAWETEERSFSVFSYRLSGHSVFRIEGTEISVGAGDLIYIPEGITYSQESEGDHIIAIHFKAEGITDRTIFCFRDLPKDDFLLIRDEWSFGAAEARFHAQARFLSLLSRLSHDHAEARDPRIELAIGYMRKNLSRPSLSIPEIAEAVGTSDVFLRRLMRRDLGASPLAYLTALRIEAAKERLVGGYESVGEIALACGFSDGKHFAEVFRRTTGLTASEYRRGLRA